MSDTLGLTRAGRWLYDRGLIIPALVLALPIFLIAGAFGGMAEAIGEWRSELRHFKALKGEK